MEKIDPQESLKIDVLNFLDKFNNASSLKLSEDFKLDHQVIVGVLKSLDTLEKVVLSQKESKCLNLTKDGQDVLKNGSLENILMKYLITNNLDNFHQSELSGKLNKEVETRGFSTAMKLKLISIDKEKKISVLKKDFNYSEDKIQKQLADITANPNNLELFDQDTLNNLIKKEKLVKIDSIKYYEVAKGPNFSLSIEKLETEITTDLLKDDKWKTKQFKKYNYNTLGAEIKNSALHPLLRVRTQFREIMLELGFEEMPTNNFVENSFWNFDTLFQPQVFYLI